MFHIEYQVIKCCGDNGMSANENVISACHSQLGQQLPCRFTEAAFGTIADNSVAKLASGSESYADFIRANEAVLWPAQTQDNNCWPHTLCVTGIYRQKF